jgi:putative DNA-invertase from lambdoid prophage Rac
VRAAIYARVSTEDQRCDLQLTELRDYCARNGWDSVEYVEKASGKAGGKRPQLDWLLRDAKFKRFEIVLVWKLDRFGRSLQHLIENVRTLNAAGVRFIAVTQGIDTDNSSPMGTFLLHIFGAFAEFERNLIVERVRAGVAEAKRQGKHCGRPARIFRRDEAVRMRAEGMSWRVIAKSLDVPFSTLRGAVRKAGLQGLSSTKQTIGPVSCSGESE